MTCDDITFQSRELGRKLTFRVYGTYGKPAILFPDRNWLHDDFEKSNLLTSVDAFVEEGQLQLFCPDSIDEETWSCEGDGRKRIERHEAWYRAITSELMPRALKLNAIGNMDLRAGGALAIGCSMGAMHALNFFLRRPGLFDSVIALSGVYDAQFFFGPYMDDIMYLNSPEHYMRNLSPDHPYIPMYNQCPILLCTGQGEGDQHSLKSTHMMETLFRAKRIRARVDYWGSDVEGNTDWYMKQLPYFLHQVLSL